MWRVLLRKNKVFKRYWECLIGPKESIGDDPDVILSRKRVRDWNSEDQVLSFLSNNLLLCQDKVFAVIHEVAVRILYPNPEALRYVSVQAIIPPRERRKFEDRLGSVLPYSIIYLHKCRSYCHSHSKNASCDGLYANINVHHWKLVRASLYNWAHLLVRYPYTNIVRRRFF